MIFSIICLSIALALICKAAVRKGPDLLFGYAFFLLLLSFLPIDADLVVVYRYFVAFSAAAGVFMWLIKNDP